jgi:TonB-linked SusC/RagA family outer membrane protein
MNRWVRHFLVLLAATAVSATQLQAQATGEVRGFVTDADFAAALADVTIEVAGQTVLSAQAGFFVVESVPAGVHTLRASLIGYRSFETEVTVTAGGTTDLEVKLAIAPMEMAPIVAIGYGEVQTSEQTGVVTAVPAEAFNTGRIVTAEELIKGKVAGVQVTENNGGEPGGGTSIRIRGGTSITSSNEPLYVIDGVPLEVGGGLGALAGNRSPLAFLNPDDIASFTVLKDASATAIYGSRGANGVILIETTAGRQGAGGGARVSYQGTMSGSTISGQPDILDAAQLRTAVQQHAPSQFQYLGTANTDWYDAVTRNGFGQQHTLAVAGGGDRMDFRVSLGYLNQEGTVKFTGMDRATLNFAYNQLLFSDRLSLKANLLGARSEQQFTGGGQLFNATNMAPTQPIEDPNSIYGGYFEWDDPLATNNPVGEANLVFDEGVGYRSVGNVTAEYAFPKLDGLSLTGRLGYTVVNGERPYFAPSIAKFQTEAGQFGTVTRNNGTEFSYLGDLFFTYQGNWGAHGLNAVGGYSYQKWETDTAYQESQQLSTDLLGPWGVPTAGFQRQTLFAEESKLASWFGRANYSFADKYMLTATVRWDGSSRFGPENQWGTFPSFSGAWRLSEESFMDGADWLSDLRLRASWGKNGNQAFGNYQFYKDYTFGESTAQALFGDRFVPTVRPSAADPNLRWEETSSWNLGIDYGFNNNRYWGSIEFYEKTTDDLIFDVIVAGGTNLSNVVTTNVGSMKNSGLELTLNAMFLEGSGDGLSWDANFNFAYNNNELTKINSFSGGSEQILAGDAISGGVGSFIQVLEPGQDVNSFFVYEHILDGSGNPIYEDRNEDGSINDQDLYVDRNDDGIINQDDRAATYSPAPDWIMGHTTLMSYKSFDFSLTLLAQLGNYVYNNVASSTGFYDQLVDSARPSNLHGSVLTTGFERPQYFSDYYVENAGFLRLQNIELGYTFRRALNGIRVYGVVQNAFTITGYSGVDPTASTDGIDNNRYPRTRTFTAGLSILF